MDSYKSSEIDKDAGNFGRKIQFPSEKWIEVLSHYSSFLLCTSVHLHYFYILHGNSSIFRYQGDLHSGGTNLASTPLSSLKPPRVDTAPVVPPPYQRRDSDRYCGLCAAWFNNPLMAQQHYDGKKHKKNAARVALLEQLGTTLDMGELRVFDCQRPLKQFWMTYTVLISCCWHCRRINAFSQKHNSAKGVLLYMIKNKK
ncbi:hypothetical protein FD755_015242 [Muntiacus reevesi]|uniref:U1-type domain-containing protein n=1 Tax=Muntiacus reevesi TaxID=9886 RepID=A0A5N3XIL1_MUNRE|nr:hypothetical protein FD755_015242 [Muntiacus reevesi]